MPFVLCLFVSRNIIIPARQMEYDRLKATRVGEASNPGPSSQLTICHINPTAVTSKKDVILALDADVIALSETSATPVIQQEFANSIRFSPYRIWWGCPVDDKVKNLSAVHHGLSRRGEACGTAIMCRLPSRAHRIGETDVLWHSCRFNSCVCTLGDIEVIFVCVYFFPGRTTEAQVKNNTLLTMVYDFLAKSGMPFIVAGDFNQRIQNLTAWLAFEHLNCVEGFQFAENNLGKTLPPTCRNATKFDSFIFHPLLAKCVVDMWVGPEHIFADHSPIYVKFSISQNRHDALQLFMPEDWSVFPLDSTILHKQYCDHALRNQLHSHTTSTATPARKFELWSRTVEQAVNSTLQIMHSTDPMRYPQKHLPPKFWGRCKTPKFVQPTPPRSVSHDPSGDYNPMGEPSSLKSCLKIRQTRRLTSLYRQLHRNLSVYHTWKEIPDSTRYHLQQEWTRIRHAQGYGRSWEKWALSFEHVLAMPSCVPDLSYLDMFVQITKYDANITVRQEEKMRRLSRKHQISLDQKDKNGSLIFQSLRDPEQKLIPGLPCAVISEAKRIRVSKGRTRLLLTDDVVFRPGKALFAQIEIQIQIQEGRLLQITTTATDIPTRGQLQQAQYSEDIDQLSKHFFNYWMPMWGRETETAARDESEWTDALEEILTNIPTQPPIRVSCDNPHFIKETIDKMKSYKAPGADGWRAQELKLLPFSAIVDLAALFTEVWPLAYDKSQMLARVILLAKTAHPNSFSDGRPITILGYIPRLSSKLIADQCLAAWGKTWDPKIAGGLPFRSVKDITIQQQFLLEQAHNSNIPQGGFTLDLVKAFNLIPRQMAKRLLVHMGVPLSIIGFWIRSLNHMERTLQIKGFCSKPVPSTTGAPEGDALSVCAMLAIAAVYFHRMSLCRVTPFTYADNWTFMSNSQRSLFRAFTSTLNFAQALQMKVDLKKSWGWGMSKEMRLFWKQTECLFPDQQTVIEVKQASKDLGCMMQYTRKITLGCFKERMKGAGRRLMRLSKHHISVHDKASKIQTAVWPLAFYGAESQLIGEAHFTRLRRQATEALVGHHKFASSFLALHILSPKVDDPLLFVISTALRSLRRLFQYHPALANDMWDRVLTSSVSPVEHYRGT